MQEKTDYFLIGAVVFIVFMFLVFLSVLLDFGDGIKDQKEKNLIDFQSACSSVNGKTVWNGRELVCIK
jgi:hypothetical protein